VSLPLNVTYLGQTHVPSLPSKSHAHTRICMLISAKEYIVELT